MLTDNCTVMVDRISLDHQDFKSSPGRIQLQFQTHEKTPTHIDQFLFNNDNILFIIYMEINKSIIINVVYHIYEQKIVIEDTNGK